MKFQLKRIHRYIPEQELIDDVIGVAKQLGKNTVTFEDYLKYGKYHPATLASRFKSWFNVMQKAGLEASRSPINIDTGLLFKNLEEVWLRIGKQPTTNQMLDPKWKSLYGVAPYRARFGSWANTLEKFIEYQNSKKPGSAQVQHRGRVLGKGSRVKNKRVYNKKREEGLRGISLKLRFSVFVRDGFRCAACGTSPMAQPGVKLHCDHIVPWSKGGKTVIDNLQTLCSDCNLGKGSKV